VALQASPGRRPRLGPRTPPARRRFHPVARRAAVGAALAGGVTAAVGLGGAAAATPLLGSQHLSANPNLAFVLFVLGLAGLCFEISHPGLNVPGLLGLVSFIAGIVLLARLPVDAAGVILIVLAFVFFVVELRIGAHSVLGLAGTVSLVLGGLFLYDPSVSDAKVSLWLLIPLAVVLGALFIVIARVALRARHLPVTTGADQLIGEEAVVTQRLHPAGQVRVRGEVWAATFDDAKATASVGTKVVVSDLRGLTLYVAPLQPMRGESAPAPLPGGNDQ